MFIICDCQQVNVSLNLDAVKMEIRAMSIRYFYKPCLLIIMVVKKYFQYFSKVYSGITKLKRVINDKTGDNAVVHIVHFDLSS